MTEQDTEVTLSRALAALDPVPVSVTEAARSAFSWIEVSAQVAELVQDTRQDLVGVRASSQERHLVFRSPTHEIHLAVTEGPPHQIAGRFLPAEPASIVAHTATGTITTETRRSGRFQFDAVPHGPIRLEVTTESGGEIIAEWTSL